MALSKIVEISPMTRSRRLMTLEPTVQLITPGTSEGLSEKIASEAAEWAKCVKPEDGKTFLLVLALGASEYYGPNRNGDGFRESELKKTYKTFEEHAHVFKSHVNKDPEKAIGHVVKAFYNNIMHRVELIICLHDDKAPDVAMKAANNGTVAVSMGCRIKYDVCSICGNKAPSRKDYCKHAKNELNDIYPDGRIVFVDNPNPKFFDISVVFRPADRTGYMMKKVAFSDVPEKGIPSSILGEKVADLEIIAKYLNKAADIDKVVRGYGAVVGGGKEEDRRGSLQTKWLKHVVPKILSDYAPVDNDDLGWLSGKEFPKVLSTLSEMGILLTTPEFMNLFFLSVTGKPAPENAVSKLIDLQGDILRLMAKHPELAKDVMDTGLFPKEASFDMSVYNRMAKYLPYRSLNDNYLRNRDFRKTSAVNPNLGNMSTLSYHDPESGRFYTTTRERAELGQEIANEEKAVKLLGAGALGLGAYKGLASLLPSKLKLLAMGSGVATSLGAASKIDDDMLMTREGIPVSARTDFQLRTASIKTSTSLAADYARNSSSFCTSKDLEECVEKTAKVIQDPLLGMRMDFNSVAEAVGRTILGI